MKISIPFFSQPTMSEKVKKAINSLAKSTLQEDDAVTVNGFRSLLSENGFEFTDSEFKTIKPLVKAAFAKLVRCFAHSATQLTRF